MASLFDDTVKGLKTSDAVPQRPAFVKHKVFAELVNGTHTDFAVIVYSNRVFATITQCGKIGNLYTVVPGSAEKNRISPASSLVIYDINCLLGVESEVGTQAVRALAEKLDITQPLLVSLTLPVLDYSTITQVAEILLRHKCW